MVPRVRMHDVRERRAYVVQTILGVLYATCYDMTTRTGEVDDGGVWLDGCARAATRASLHFVVPFVVVGGADIRKRFDKRRRSGFHDVTPLACLVA